MFDLEAYLRDTDTQVEARLGKKSPDEILLLRRADGSRFVLRRYAAPVPAYQSLVGVKCPSLPEVYRCMTEDGAFLVEEEYVDGISLQALLETTRPDDAQTAAITAQVCTALEVLHAHGIVHRDVKPKNVLLTSASRVVLIDLDASAALDPEKSTDTRLLGTPGYAAPEQFGFSRSDVRTDVFALGVMMNVMRTGEHPSRRLAAGRMGRIVQRAINVNADRRYADAAQLRRALPAYPKTAAPCPDCGFVTPGGGCLCCGKPSRKKPARLWWCIALVATAVLIVGALLLRPTFVPAPKPTAVPAPTQTLTSTPEPTPTPDPLQLYYKYGDNDYATTYANPAGGGSWLPLYYVDSAGAYVPLARENTLRCDEGFGSTSWRSDRDCWEWVVKTLPPGLSGRLYAMVDGAEYHMDCTTAMADLGVYDREPDTSDPAAGYLGPALEDVTVPAGLREVWIVVGDDFFMYDNWRITALDATDFEVEQLWDGQLLHLTLPEGADLTQHIVLTLSVFDRDFVLHFSGN